MFISGAFGRMVGQLAQKYPHLMLEHVARLKECLDYYTFIHPISASSLIYNVCPLLHLSPDLQVRLKNPKIMFKCIW